MRTADSAVGWPGPVSVSICKVWDADYPWDVRVEKVCRSLGAEHDVHLVSRNTRCRRPYEVHDGLHIHRLPVLPWMPGRLHTAIGFPAFCNPLWIHAIWRTARHCQARVLLVRDLPLALTSLFVGRALGIPVILDMAENYPAMIQDVWDSGRARIGDWLVRNPRLIRIVERVSIRTADHILVVVDESRDRLLKMGVPASRVSVVMNTPPLDRWREPGAQNDAPRDSRRSGELIVGYLGMLEVSRGLDTAIYAVRDVRRRLPRVRLVIIGSGRDAPHFHETARRAGVSDCVEFRGWLPYEEALACLARWDVGLVPHHVTESWQTTIPNKLFDYMSLGKPVIVSNAGPAARIVTEEACGLVFPDRDAAALAEAIAGMREPTVRDAYGRSGREAIRQRYNWHADERRLLRVVRDAVTPVSGRDDAALRMAAPASERERVR